MQQQKQLKDNLRKERESQCCSTLYFSTVPVLEIFEKEREKGVGVPRGGERGARRNARSLASNITSFTNTHTHIQKKRQQIYR